MKTKFPHLRSGEVVRIRSAMVDETSSTKKVLLLSHYSNIMTFIGGSKIAKDLKGKVHDEHEKSKQKVQHAAVVLTEVDKKYQNMKVTPLHELFHEADQDPELGRETTFRTMFSVAKIEPSDVKEWVKSYDKKAKKATSMKGQKGASTGIY